MKSLAVVSFFAVAALVGLPVGAQTVAPPAPPPAMPAGVAPQPYQPPYQQMPATQPPQGLLPGQNAEDFSDNQVGEAPPQAPLPLPGGDEVGAGIQAQPVQYDPNSPADPANQNVVYPPADLGPDNEIAQSYDDGYDPQAYTQFQSALAPSVGGTTTAYGNVWSPYASTVGAGFSPYASCGHWADVRVRLDLGFGLELGLGAVSLRPLAPRAGRGWSWVLERCGDRPGSPGARAAAMSAGRRSRRGACASPPAPAGDRPGGSRRRPASAPRAPRSSLHAICRRCSRGRPSCRTTGC